MPLTFIAAGSNLGDRENNLDEARRKIVKGLCLKEIKASKIYETEPVGGPPQGKFLNAVWQFETDLPARTVLEGLLKIEKEMGRVRREANGPRTIDLDILFYGNKIIHERGLDVPHPRLHERLFVLDPLAEIASDWMHPEMKKTVAVLREEARARN